MTFAVLRALHAIIGDALDDVERVYAAQHPGLPTPDATLVDSSTYPPSLLFTKDSPRRSHKANVSTSSAYASPPPSPGMSTHPMSGSDPSSEKPLDFPSLDAPCDPTSLAEALTAHPTVVVAINRILAAAGQMSATVQTPFLTLCDATMGYHLPSCMRILEASNTVEILREAGSGGLHVRFISELNGVEESKLAHILRLLATHHILREVSPDVFALNRISSLVDSGKTFKELKELEASGKPEIKYQDTNGIAAFVGLCTDEIYKSSAYLTETYLLSPSKQTREGQEPTQAPFCYAFDTVKSGTGYFGWLEGETGGFGKIEGRASMDFAVKAGAANPNRFRLERFGKAMSGTGSWEAPGAVLNGFDWTSLPKGSTVVDVGGGIGSTSMLLATASEDVGLGLKFIIQDRSVVVEMGEKAWRAKCPELLDVGTAVFQEHDFFAPQPIKDAAVFLLRVILHDWPDDFARRILLQLREAATPQTKLLIADWVLPLACPDDMGSTGGLEGVEGAESILAPAPLLPNLGKASANAYWMDLTMQVMFNAQERTLREIVALALSAGWKVTKVTKAVGSLFGHIVAVPVPIPAVQKRADIDSTLSRIPSLPSVVPISASVVNSSSGASIDGLRTKRGDIEMRKRSGSRCDTFGSRTELSSFEEALAKFGGGVMRTKYAGMGSRSASIIPKPIVPKTPIGPNSIVRKKRPSPLCVPLPLPSSSSPRVISRPLTSRLAQIPATSVAPQRTPSTTSGSSPANTHPSASITHKSSYPQTYQSTIPGSPLSASRPPPLSPRSPSHVQLPLSRRPSHTQLSPAVQPQTQASLSLIPIRQGHESPLSSPRLLSHPRSTSLSFEQVFQPGQRAPCMGASGRDIEVGEGDIADILLKGVSTLCSEGSQEEGRTSPAYSCSHGGAGTVLATAARIDRGLWPRTSSP
ncbi:hypothetical protein BDQ12DRAFT_689414 [Crucibulum laeve]|uniref:O-methyltransferase C-terminal domain-containing protein n=1 Tax=Crucibulum laeve TaxID=68775 RepID=A0A5C3LPF2_9AGAR|nr:hypothetical protein BDQ12DRAFT_689414 [Crucibulum laeve]